MFLTIHFLRAVFAIGLQKYLWDYSKIQVEGLLESSKFVGSLKPLANKYRLEYYGKIETAGSPGTT